MHTGIPIHNHLVPNEFTHDNGKLTGITFTPNGEEADVNSPRRPGT